MTRACLVLLLLPLSACSLTVGVDLRSGHSEPAPDSAAVRAALDGYESELDRACAAGELTVSACAEQRRLLGRALDDIAAVEALARYESQCPPALAPRLRSVLDALRGFHRARRR